MIFVTGATGKSGSHFLRALAAHPQCQDARVRVAVRPSSNLSLIQDCGMEVELAEGDLADEAFLQTALLGVDTVVHIANIAFSERIVRFALQCGVKRLILVHTTGIYSRYKSASEGYLAIEQEIERMLRDRADVALTILRPTMIYGSLHDGNVSVFIRMVDRLRLFPVVDHARYPLQPVHACDVGGACLGVLLHPETTAGRDYVVSGGAPILLIDMLKVIARGMGRRNWFISVPFPLAYFGARALCSLSGGKKDYRERVQRLVEPRAYPHEEATRDFGFRPLSFEEGVQGEIAEYLQEKNPSAKTGP